MPPIYAYSPREEGGKRGEEGRSEKQGLQESPTNSFLIFHKTYNLNKAQQRSQMKDTYMRTYLKTNDYLLEQYRALHNLYLLKNFTTKLSCYHLHAQAADKYFECFNEAEMGMVMRSEKFVKDCQLIEDQFKVCLNDCVDNYGAGGQNCQKQCSVKYERAINVIYDNFYRANVGMEPEYKKYKR